MQAALGGDFDLVVVSQTAASPAAPEILRRIKEAPTPPPLVILGRNATVEAAVAAMQGGGIDSLDESTLGRERCKRFSARAGLLQPAIPKAPEIEPDGLKRFEGMLGQCLAMQQVFALIRRIAPADSTVLVHGESGTGKEMVVRAIHRLSRRGR